MTRVRITAEAAREFERMPLPIQTRMAKVFERLERWPYVSGVKALRGSLQSRFRLRTGDYRVQIRVRGDVVHVEKVGHRDGFYEE